MTTTTTLPLPPPPQQQSTTDPTIASRVSALEQVCVNFEKRHKLRDKTVQGISSIVFTLELRDLPHNIDQTVNEVVKEAVQTALQAPLRERFRDLSETNIKEILHQRMFDSGSYKSHPDHKALYEALEVSMDRDNQEELHETLTTSRKRRQDDQDSLPPPPTKESEQSKKKKQDILIPDVEHMSDSEDTGVAHLLNIKTRPDWLKHVPKEDKPETPKPDWVIPPNDPPEPENNLANAFAASKSKLSKADLEGPAYKVVRAFHLNNISLQFQMEECHLLLTDQIDVLNLGVGTEQMIFNIDSAMKHSYSNDDTCFSIDVIDEILEEDFDALLDEDYKIKTSLEEPPTDPELKPLPDNLEYVFLEEPSFLTVIISSQLSSQNKRELVSILKRHKEAFAWKTTDIPGICPSFFKHKIQLLDDKKPVVQKQRRLNPNMQEVVKKEIMKLLDNGIIYPIAISPWVSPIHCLPKKGGITVVTNENDELVPTRTVTGWRVCIDYRKLNEATTKDHFPLPFMDQMLERLTGNKYFCFLDGVSGYFQIPIDPMDQEKTTFTCPFGTYAYRRMPFGLCNAPATFQRCMLEIFHDMIEESVKVFMDDFSVFGNSFDKCLNNLDKMLQRCKDAHLVLNWEKCHFMVKEGIVLGHKVSGAGLEVNKAKIYVILKLPPPTNIKGVRSFLGHAGFYRRFIKDFSKLPDL
ncbi:reverse transcriptase domain-containing protein [Tanacetum coccineum]